MNFTNRENYDTELIDYIIDGDIKFEMIDENLMHTNGEYYLCIIRRSDPTSFFMGLSYKMESVYDYTAESGSYRYVELETHFLELFTELDLSNRKNKLVRNFLGDNRGKKISKITKKINAL